MYKENRRKKKRTNVAQVLMFKRLIIEIPYSISLSKVYYMFVPSLVSYEYGVPVLLIFENTSQKLGQSLSGSNKKRTSKPSVSDMKDILSRNNLF